MRVSCITLYSTFAVKAGVNNSGKAWSPNIIQLIVLCTPRPVAVLVRILAYSHL